MMQIELVRELLARQSATGSRSTALQPLCWLVGILALGLTWSATKNAPNWVLIVLSIFLGLVLLLLLFFYGYFAIKNPDALRSEKFTLSKMAIEKNLIGDDATGLFERSTDADSKAVRALPFQKKSEQ